MKKKAQVRAKFRSEVFERDDFLCKVCEVPDQFLDAHHITSRDVMPNGGYVKENGIALCPDCHFLAECWEPGEESLYCPEALYELIGSSYELAYKAAERKGE